MSVSFSFQNRHLCIRSNNFLMLFILSISFSHRHKHVYELAFQNKIALNAYCVCLTMDCHLAYSIENRYTAQCTHCVYGLIQSDLTEICEVTSQKCIIWWWHVMCKNDVSAPRRQCSFTITHFGTQTSVSWLSVWPIRAAQSLWVLDIQEDAFNSHDKKKGPCLTFHWHMLLILPNNNKIKHAIRPSFGDLEVEAASYV